MEVRYSPLDAAGFPGYRAGSDGSIWKNGSPVEGAYAWINCKKTFTGSKEVINVRGVDGKRHVVAVHKLILLAFVGPCPSGMECCHYDGNPANNQLDNLRWDTPKGNQADKKRHGTSNEGERNPSAKLIEAQVREIRASYAAGGVSMSDLCRTYGITLGTVCPLINRKTWKNVN